MVYVTATSSTAFTTEATTKNTSAVIVDGVSHDAYTVYYITAAAKRYWDPENGVTVYKGGVEVTTGFTVQYCGGFIIFDSANLNTDEITVTGKYYAYEKAAGIKSYSAKLGWKTADTTAYNDTNDEVTPITRNGSGSLSLIEVDAYFCDLLGSRIIGVFHLAGTYNANDSSGARYEAYIRFSDFDITLPSGDIITATHNYTVEKEWHFRSA
jgi:hypothetical protein